MVINVYQVPLFLSNLRDLEKLRKWLQTSRENLFSSIRADAELTYIYQEHSGTKESAR